MSLFAILGKLDDAFPDLELATQVSPRSAEITIRKSVIDLTKMQ